MSEMLNVAEQVKAGAKRLEWVLRLAEQLERIGSLEQAEGDARKRLEAARASLEEAEHAVRLEMVGVSNARSEAARLIREAEEASAASLEAARKEAEDLVRNAGEQAAKIEAAAKAAFEESTKQADELKRLAKEAADEARKQATQALDEAAEARRELEHIEERIAKARESAKQLIGNV